MGNQGSNPEQLLYVGSVTEKQNLVDQCKNYRAEVFPVNKKMLDQPIAKSPNFLIFVPSTSAKHMVWCKPKFSTFLLMEMESRLPLRVWHYKMILHRNYRFGVICIDPIAAHHMSFMLDKSMIFLTTEEFLERLVGLSTTKSITLPRCVVSRKERLQDKLIYTCVNPREVPVERVNEMVDQTITLDNSKDDLPQRDESPPISQFTEFSSGSGRPSSKANLRKRAPTVDSQDSDATFHTSGTLGSRKRRSRTATHHSYTYVYTSETKPQSTTLEYTEEPQRAPRRPGRRALRNAANGAESDH
jgi:hypothetical protein